MEPPPRPQFSERVRWVKKTLETRKASKLDGRGARTCEKLEYLERLWGKSRTVKRRMQSKEKKGLEVETRGKNLKVENKTESNFH